jgi:TatD DNase family protein
MMNAVDSHNHIHFKAFRKDMDQVIRQAFSAGVSSMLAVGIDPEDCRKALAVAGAYEGILVSLGIHPQNAGTYSVDEVHALSQLASDGPIVAVGETGFDLYRTPESEGSQEELFRAHIELARELDLPLVIHDREAHVQTCRVLDDMNAWSLGGVFHCFSGDVELARLVTKRGFLISIPGVVTYKNAAVLKDVVREIPGEFLLAETDAPYLTPEPFRGKRNEPQYVMNTIMEMAKIKDMHSEDLSRITTENFKRLFFRRSSNSPASLTPEHNGGPR